MNIRIVSHTLSGIGFGLFLISLYFKISHWPGATIMKISAFGFIILGSILRITPAYKKGKRNQKVDDVLDN